jgi:hypothetical protein
MDSNLPNSVPARSAFVSVAASSPPVPTATSSDSKFLPEFLSIYHEVERPHQSSSSP